MRQRPGYEATEERILDEATRDATFIRIRLCGLVKPAIPRTRAWKPFFGVPIGIDGQDATARSNSAWPDKAFAASSNARWAAGALIDPAPRGLSKTLCRRCRKVVMKREQPAIFAARRDHELSWRLPEVARVT